MRNGIVSRWTFVRIIFTFSNPHGNQFHNDNSASDVPERYERIYTNLFIKAECCCVSNRKYSWAIIIVIITQHAWAIESFIFQ